MNNAIRIYYSVNRIDLLADKITTKQTIIARGSFIPSNIWTEEEETKSFLENILSLRVKNIFKHSEECSRLVLRSYEARIRVRYAEKEDRSFALCMV